MNDYLIKASTLTEIASAIRYKLGSSDALPVLSMPDAIRRISGGSGGSGDDELEWDAFVAGMLSVINDTDGQVTFLPSGAFVNYKCLKKVNFPAVSFIGSHAFEDCENLEAVYLSAVTSIDDYAFVGCTKLMSVYFTGVSSVPSMYSNLFRATPMIDSSYTGAFGSIYVPESLVSSFKNAQLHDYHDRIVGV